MASYDGTNKSSAGCAQNLPYWEIKTDYVREIYDQALANATPEAVKFCNVDCYNGPDVEVDASTLSEDEWQARRSNHLGGSDIAAIFGENEYKTNLDLYYSKTGQQPVFQEEEDSKSRLNKLWGHISEEYIDAWLSERYPYNKIITDTNIYSMPGKPYITANIDRMMQKLDGSYCLVEMKTASSFKKREWENGNIPIPYIYQVRTYMAILGVWECLVVCMFDRDTLVANTIKRDLDEEMRIIQGIDDFWLNNVLTHIPPKPLGEPKALLDSIHRYTSGASKGVPAKRLAPDMADICKQYIQVKAECEIASRTIKQLERKCKELTIPIAEAMGNSVDGNVTDSGGVTYNVKYSPKYSREGIDMKKLEALYPQAYHDCYIAKKETSRTLTIKSATRK